MSEMIFDPKRVIGFQHVDIEAELGSSRLYWKTEGEHQGFRFVAYAVTGMVLHPDDPNGDADPYSKLDTEVEILLYGTAAFDGVRHLYFGHEMSHNYGYQHCPNIELLSAILRELRQLEKAHCQNPQYLNV